MSLDLNSDFVLTNKNTAYILTEGVKGNGNVRFLSNFLTEAGIIIKRSQTKISAKAQRKVAREIKTARALGLMPFTTMGKKPFMFGRSAEEDASEEEYGYDFVEKDAGPEDAVADADAVPDVEAA
ncbi:hypothetical protein ACQJBY_006407 [Aegilops geniculata]